MQSRLAAATGTQQTVPELWLERGLALPVAIVGSDCAGLCPAPETIEAYGRYPTWIAPSTP
jgi:hypothetical protein